MPETTTQKEQEERVTVPIWINFTLTYLENILNPYP